MANKSWMDKGADGLTFGERLGDLLAESGISQAKLSKEIGIVQSAISDYLKKDRAPDCGSVIALANYFGVTTDYLLGLSKVKTSDNSIQTACNVTGLSEKIIECLIRIRTNQPEAMPAINELFLGGNKEAAKNG